jgi:predicted ATPase
MQQSTESPNQARDRMLLVSFRIDNFKSLVEFEVPLAKLTCLVGLNGAGKSAVIQALDFASRLFLRHLDGFMGERGWKASDLNSKLVAKSNIVLRIEAVRGDNRLVWQGSFNRNRLQCTQEVVHVNGKRVYRLNDGVISIGTGAKQAPLEIEVVFDYTGSTLSALELKRLRSPTLRSFVGFMRRLTSLDLLSPQSLRRRTDASDGRLGLGGERLSAFLYELPAAKREQLLEQLAKCYPRLSDVSARSLRRGWKELSIVERFGKRKLSIEATHINDGMLRLMAILAETLTESSFLLFDEIENGINPELVEFLLDSLLEAPQQVLVTTHSPMILNWLDDDVARAGVQYLYRDTGGRTQAIPFFEIPSLAEKLEVMGPGEAFVDTDLTALQDEIDAMSATDQD